jgi:type IV pilus assembly protein PilB
MSVRSTLFGTRASRGGHASGGAEVDRIVATRAGGAGVADRDEEDGAEMALPVILGLGDGPDSESDSPVLRSEGDPSESPTAESPAGEGVAIESPAAQSAAPEAPASDGPAPVSSFPPSPPPVSPAPPTQPLGEMLIGRGATTTSVVRQALRRQQKEGRRIGELLVESGVEEGDVVAALGEQLGYRTVELEGVGPRDETRYLLDAATARRLGALPFLLDDGGNVHYATADPGDQRRIDEVRQAIGRPVVPRLTARRSLEDALNRHFSVLDQVGLVAERAARDERVAPRQATELAGLSADAPVVQIVNLILTQGLRDRASDIHLEPQADRLRVRFRVDGALRDVQSLPIQLAGAIASRLKIMSEMDIVDRHRPQDGQTTMSVDGRTVDIRIATAETVWGEKVVLRLLDRSRSLVPLDQLGLRDEEHRRLERLIASPYGLLIVGGPTGAGKTTTLYAALNELDRGGRNITTIEDPVEYQFADINQIQINRLAGMTFATGLRAILRQDPDVILIGEIRDAETAQIAVQSALTGHLVLASLHAADAVGALHRFLDMGLESYLVASALIGVVAQRLVRLNCEVCSEVSPIHPDEAEFFRSVRDTTPQVVQLVGRGCRRCNGTGFYDRRGVFECLTVDDDIRERVIDRVHQSRLREHVRSRGMRSLQDAACELVEQGKTTLAEAMRTVFVG